MSHCQEEIFADLSKTLDQLLQNTKTLQTPKLKLLCATEIDLLKKTQESLSAHFIHTRSHLESRKKERMQKLEKKIAELKKLDPALYEIIAKTLSMAPVVGFRPRVGRNRKRSKASEFAYCGL